MRWGSTINLDQLLWKDLPFLRILTLHFRSIKKENDIVYFKYVKQTFVFNAEKIMNSLKLQRWIVPVNYEYREFVKEEVVKKFGNINL